MTYDGVETEMVWWDEAFSNEIGSFLEIIFFFNLVCF
jgi:hypothetical protein